MTWERRISLVLTTVAALVLAGPVFAQNYMFEFSLDIGSDTELSDPFMDGDEVFDPGDVYWWQGPVFPGPTNGFKDDFRIFGYDPDPDPMIPTRVPVGFGSVEEYEMFFDLDGHDQLDIELLDIQWPHHQVPSNCIYKPDFLQISFDDDQAPGWPANDVPVTAPSPAGFIYGTSWGRDEIIGLNLTYVPGGMPPYLLAGMYPIADEITVHQSMQPNPDMMEEDDDDVDSLDIVPDEGACPIWYFSADHEANLGLDPGGIYQVLGGGGFVQVIDEAFHLGIPEDTDIDAFEFVWLEEPQEPGPLYLALIYSVDDNDPLTLADESGGMNPAVIYASFMTGYSFRLTDPLEDDIDGLTVWHESLEEEPTEACCLIDGTCLDVTPTDCINNYGGMPMGVGTTCATLPPTIIAGPTDVSACENDDVVLSVTVCGATPMNYQWYKDGIIMPGEINPTLTLLDIRPADAGAYHVDVSNAYGGPVSSGAALVTVQVKADSNCDGIVNNFDIDPFVLALTAGQAAWEALYPCDFFCANDINRDGVVDNFDIDPFVACLLSGGCP